MVVRRRREPSVWAKKYFVAASYSLLLGVFVIRGIKANRLSSMPMYMVIQLVADRAMSVPDRGVRVNSELDHLRVNI